MRMRAFTRVPRHDKIITHADADAHAGVPKIVYVMCDLSEACVQHARRLRCFQPLLAARAVDFARCLCASDAGGSHPVQTHNLNPAPAPLNPKP